MINEGTNVSPRYGEPQLIHADGQPIRFVRNELLGDPPSTHNMGYSYPWFIDWNDDELPDLIFPNETNRIFWYQNIGSRDKPEFGPQQQILVDGYPDSDSIRTRTAQRAVKQNPNGVYPQEPDRPFYWRTGAAFADWNDDGLTDFITASSTDRRATLFVQYRTAAGELKVRKGEELKLTDGRPIDDRLVDRRSHWTESYRPVDWNRDGKIDLVYSLAGAHNGIQDGGSMYLLLNSGTKAAPLFEPPQTLKCFGKPIRITNHGPHPWVGDLDGDGEADLVPCVEWSVYPFYAHAALAMPERPEFEIDRIVD
ncbi:MAG: VCBS repeat-containing protein [Planctomycetaceae bacterium]|nr:VCBS repeat-containing protein [Planctomycetaceae bacterium]